MSEARRPTSGVLGIGVVACAACCAGPALGWLAAASLGALLGAAALGLVGLGVGLLFLVPYWRRRRSHTTIPTDTPVLLGGKPDA